MRHEENCSPSGSSGGLGLWTLSNVWYSKRHKRTRRFGNWICFCPHMRGGIHLQYCIRQKDITSISGQPKSESELLYDWRFTANQFVLATSPLRLTTSNFIFRLNACGYSLYVTSSLTRMGLSFTIAAGPRRRSHSHVRVPRKS
jgi:hypothetical protein